jgi:hypothetical protein
LIRIQEIVEDWKKTILGIPGVTGIGRAGSPEGRIIVYVERLEPRTLSAIPSEIEGIPVVVRTTGRIRLLSLLPPAPTPAPVAAPVAALEEVRTSRLRPAPGGVSIGNPRITAGTFSCMVLDALTGRPVGLSNNHVLLSAPWGNLPGGPGEPVWQPGKYDGGTSEDRVGTTLRGVGVSTETERENLVDAAVFEPLSPDILSPEVLGFPLGVPYRPPLDPKPGMVGAKSGRTTGVTTSTIESIGATVDVDGGEAGTCRFTDQIIFRPAFARGGDSGSAVVEVSTGRILGLVFAGSDEITVVCRADHIESLLGIRFGVAGLVPGVPMVPSILPIQLPIVFGSLLFLASI